jgi:hypothetical protein
MTDSWLVLGPFGAVILAAVAAMTVAVRMGIRRWPVTPQPTAIPADLQLRVRTLLSRNRAAQAICEVRESTGLNLKEAKVIVDTFRRGPLPEPPVGPYGVGSPGSLAERAKDLRNGGDLPSAVALVCAESGMTQREAELFVSILD